MLLGLHEHHVSVNKDIICKNSKLFKDSFSSDPDAKFFELQEFDPELFKTYIDWLYTGKLSWHREIATDVEDQGNLIEAYIFADLTDDARFRGEMLGELIEGACSSWNTPFSDCQISRIWEATPEESCLRHFTLEWIAARWRREHVVGLIKGKKVPRKFFEQGTLWAMYRMDRVSREECEDLLKERFFPSAPCAASRFTSCSIISECIIHWWRTRVIRRAPGWKDSGAA